MGIQVALVQAEGQGQEGQNNRKTNKNKPNFVIASSGNLCYIRDEFMVNIERGPIPEDRLAAFLIEGKKNGFAAGNMTEEEDGSFSTRFENEEFIFHDNWRGGEPYMGTEFVDKKPTTPDGRPIASWGMQYWGEDDGTTPGTMTFLRKALEEELNNNPEVPLRGPKRFEEGKFVYENRWTGDLSKFEGRETITFNGRQVYWADYRGGDINKRADQL